jgi:hypothetical protein
MLLFENNQTESGSSAAAPSADHQTRLHDEEGMLTIPLLATMRASSARLWNADEIYSDNNGGAWYCVTNSEHSLYTLADAVLYSTW